MTSRPGRPPRIRVAFVIGGLPFGGVENWLYDLASHLEGREDVEYLIVNVSGTGVKVPEFEAAGLRLLNLQRSTSALNTHRLDTLLKLRRVLKDYKPDIVHALHFSGNYFGRLACLGLGAAVITHIRVNIPERKPVRRFFDRFLSRFTDLYLSVSKDVARCVDTHQNRARRPSRVLYNAVDPGKLDVAPIDLKAMYGPMFAPGAQVILGVGRFTEQKNFDLLVEAFGLVLPDCPDARLVLVGEGYERPDLEARIARLGLQGKAVLTGYRRDVPAFLRAARILAMPSRHEGLPITHLEAMFCGLPAVVSRNVPSIEIAAEACLVCETEPESIAGCLRRLLREPDLHARMSEAARAASRGRTMDAYVDELMGIYQELLAGRPSRQGRG